MPKNDHFAKLTQQARAALVEYLVDGNTVEELAQMVLEMLDKDELNELIVERDRIYAEGEE